MYLLESVKRYTVYTLVLMCLQFSLPLFVIWSRLASCCHLECFAHFCRRRCRDTNTKVNNMKPTGCWPKLQLAQQFSIVSPLFSSPFPLLRVSLPRLNMPFLLSMAPLPLCNWLSLLSRGSSVRGRVCVQQVSLFLARVPYEGEFKLEGPNYC